MGRVLAAVVFFLVMELLKLENLSLILGCPSQEPAGEAQRCGCSLALSALWPIRGRAEDKNVDFPYYSWAWSRMQV